MTKSVTTSFEKRVDNWVRAAVSDVPNFDELVTRLPGVYPTAVARSLDRALRDGTISKSEHARATNRAAAAGRKRRPRVPQILPAPHPLDYDWRYGNDTIDRLLELVVAYSAPGATIALLGTPSLYVRGTPAFTGSAIRPHRRQCHNGGSLAGIGSIPVGDQS